MKKNKIQSFIQKNFFKKNILNKLFSKFFTFFNMPKGTWNISFNQLKKKNIENYISEKFQLNYALFVLSIVFFLYLLYLSIPGIIISENIQKELEEKLKKEYNLDFALTPDINYSILPKPHYVINDVVIFTQKTGYQKEFSQIKKLKIFINQNNFFKMNNVIKKIEIKNANFFIENSDFEFIDIGQVGYSETQLIKTVVTVAHNWPQRVGKTRIFVGLGASRLNTTLCPIDQRIHIFE